MATGLIGALRITLGIDASDFEAGTSKARAEMRGFQRDFAKMGKQWQTLGKSMTQWVTLPILATGAAVIKMAGDFEAAMNQVGINASATADQMAQMREQALRIGKDTAKSATEAANAMNILAKTGMAATDILNGGAEAAVNLAIATGSELDPAAAAISDTMKQFGKTTKDLPNIINQITGAVNESKFDFADFQLGMSQAGAVASATGQSFEDFAAALAGTSSMFASGSDAGTSFKTFLLHLEPQTKKAAALMDQYGLSFYDAEGHMKSLRDIAQMLQDKLSNLSEQDRNAVMLKVFGTDAVRTAIGLMKLGSAGIDDMSKRIAATSAIDQANIRMKGFNGQLEQLKGALETLAIRIADSGLLEWATALVNGLGNIVDKLGQTNPTMLKWGVIVAGVAASFGPFMLVFGTFIKAVGVALPLLAKLGPLFQIMATGIGYLIPVVVSLSRVLIAGLLANPVLVGAAALLTGIYLAWKNWDKIGPIVQNVYNQVKTWILDKLSGVWEGVKQKISAVTGWFRDMYDAVVGHSYVPDMVDEIGQHMARLEQNMVEPAKKDAEAVKQAFLQMQQDVSSILNRLYPEEARHNLFMKELADLTAGMEKLKFTTEQTADAASKLFNEYIDNMPDDQKPFKVDINENGQEDSTEGAMDEHVQNVRDLEDITDEALKGITDNTKQKTAEMIKAWAEMARDAVGSVKGMVQAFKSGDILGGITQLLDLVVQVVGLLGGQKGGALAVFNRGGSIPQPTGPGFARGGSFTVGGSGGVDSQLIRFRATPGEMVNITHGERSNPGRPVLAFDLRGAVMTEDLLRQMSGMADQAALRGAVGGASLAQRNIRRASRSALS